MKKTLQTKLMIIENFIDHYTSHIATREKMKVCARTYVDEDHVDEIDQAGFVTAKDLVSSVLEANIKAAKFIIKATSVESSQKIQITEKHKNRLVDEDLIHFDGTGWKFFDEDMEKIIKTGR